MRFATLTLSILLFAGSAMAQQPFPRPGRGNGLLAIQALKEYLSLSDAQVTNLQSIQAAMREAIKPLAQDLAAKTKALRDEKQKTTPDQKVIDQLTADITALRAQIETQRTNYQKQARGYLTADQLTFLTKLEDVFKLMPVAHAAVMLDLISGPDGALRMPAAFGGGPRPGMMRRRGGNR